MPNNLVLVTHAEFAKGILTSLELILGNPCPTSVVSVTAKETIPTVASMIKSAIDSMDSANPTVVLTDIPGGSTTQGAILVSAERPDTYYVAGLNLGLLLEIALLPLDPDPTAREANVALLRETVEASRSSIGLIDDLTAGAAGVGEDSDSGEL